MLWRRRCWPKVIGDRTERQKSLLSIAKNTVGVHSVWHAINVAAGTRGQIADRCVLLRAPAKKRRLNEGLMSRCADKTTTFFPPASKIVMKISRRLCCTEHLYSGVEELRCWCTLFLMCDTPETRNSMFSFYPTVCKIRIGWSRNDTPSYLAKDTHADVMCPNSLYSSVFPAKYTNEVTQELVVLPI